MTPKNDTCKHSNAVPASIQKSVNLEYNTLVRWADGTIESSAKRLMFQVLFFS
jgi:hypothetical protein